MISGLFCLSELGKLKKVLCGFTDALNSPENISIHHEHTFFTPALVLKTNARFIYVIHFGPEFLTVARHTYHYHKNVLGTGMEGRTDT